MTNRTIGPCALPDCPHPEHEDVCLYVIETAEGERPCECRPCWHCKGHGEVPTGRHNGSGDDIMRQCGACDGYGQR